MEQLRRRVPGGIGTYTSSCLGAVSKLLSSGTEDDTDEIRSIDVELFASAFKGTGRDPLLDFGLPLRCAAVSQPYIQRLWDRNLANVRLRDYDLFHAFSMGGPRPTSNKTKVVFAVYDVAWRLYPETFPIRGRRWHDQALKYIQDRADAVVTLSDAAVDALESTGIERERIHVIPPGSDHLALADRPTAGQVLRTAGVKGPFILSISTLEPRKNLKRLVQAYTAFKMAGTEPIDLVIVGPDGWMVGDIALPSGVRLVGQVDEAVLAGLLAMATAVVYIPLYEGFGMPVLEANAACVPVLASPVPAADGSALVVDPLDVDAIAGAITSIISDTRLRSELVTAGLLKASELTWERTAVGHLRLWDAVSGVHV